MGGTMAGNDIVDVDSLEIIHETESAFLLDDGYEEVWIPKSQIHNIQDFAHVEIGDVVNIEIPEWLAEDKGLI
jgi:hypothetical protein